MIVLKTEKLCVRTDIYEARIVQEWFKQFDQIPRQVMMQCELVLVEAFANVIDHAHAQLPESTPIDIEVMVMADAIEIRVWDYGKPFDFMQALADKKKAEAEAQNLPIKVEELDTGGRGLLITDKVADQLSYESQPDGKNCLFIRKVFPQSNN